MIKKKGELTTQQLVTIIILVVSFVIILFLIFRLNLGDTTDKQICHNSVVLKSKSVLGGALDCKTQYVCISGGGECKDFNADEIIKVNANDRAEIMEAIAKEMADCWWMFGEGKVDYTDKWSGLYCSICSIIVFDDKIQNSPVIPDKISYTELYQFLNKTQKDSAQTYLMYLYDVFGVSDFNGFEQQLTSHVLGMKDYFSKRDSGGIWPHKQYVIVTGMIPELVYLFPRETLIFQKTKKNYDDYGCDEFLTKS